MFHETVLTACGKGRFAVTIKERMTERPAQVLSGGDGMSCEACAVFSRITHHAADIACSAGACPPRTDSKSASAVFDAEEKRRAGAESMCKPQKARGS